MLCKPSVASLPLLFWSADLIEGEDLKKSTLKYVPFFLVVAFIAVLTDQLQTRQISISTPLWQKPFIMLECYGFYLIHFIWPISLNVDYGQTPEAIWKNLTEFQMSAVFQATIPIIFMAVTFWPKTKKIFFIPMLSFFIILLPVSGIVDFGYQKNSAFADHYAYLGIIPLAGLTAMLIDRLGRKVFRLVVCSFILALTFLSWHRSRIWKSDETVSRSILKLNPRSFMAHAVLTRHLLSHQRFDEASEHIFAENDLRPTSLIAIADKTLILSYDKLYDQLIQMDPDLDKVISSGAVAEYSPPFSQILFDIGSALIIKGQQQRGYERLCLSLKYNSANLHARQSLEALAKGRNISCP
jgi:hypothetical protein